MLINFLKGLLLIGASIIAIPHVAYANNRFCEDGCSTKAVMGKVEKIALDINRLYVIDDFTKESYDFFVHDNVLKNLKVGDYVRVYYQSLQLPALHVEKMTPADFNTQTQNKGYLHKEK